MAVNPCKPLPLRPLPLLLRPLLLLSLIGSPAPVLGFALRSCGVRAEVAECQKLKLRAVPLDLPHTLRGLDLSENRIWTLGGSDFRNLPLLTGLDLHRNQISQIHEAAFEPLRSLRSLNLNDNKLEQIHEDQFSGLDHLSRLTLSRNRLRTLAPPSFSSLTALEVLDLSENKLHQLSSVASVLQQLPRLRELSVRNNDVMRFRSWELTNVSLPLQILDLSQNPIRCFQLTADVFPNLTFLNISSSAAEHPLIWDIPNPTYFRGVSTLDLSGIKITVRHLKRVLESVNGSLTALSVNSMKVQLGVLVKQSCSVTSMSSLQLRWNKLEQICSTLFQSCTNVAELDLSRNKVRKINDTAFGSLRSLRILNLSRNKLSSVPGAIRTGPRLLDLDLSFNRVDKLCCGDFSDQPWMESLNLDGNLVSALKDCVFRDLTGLKVLKLQNNHVVHLSGPFRTLLPSLEHLVLNGNRITALKPGDFAGLRSLQSLLLRNNKIHSLEPGCFSGLRNLNDLDLEKNHLTAPQLHRGPFNPLLSLRRLNLRHNRIKYENSSVLALPPFFHLVHLETLDLHSQRCPGKTHLPQNFLRGLTNLTLLDLKNLKLVSVNRDMFRHTPRLRHLHLGTNDLRLLPPELFAPIPDLQSLFISRANLWSLDFLTRANLRRLQLLKVRQNNFSYVSNDVIKSLPALLAADFQFNSFSCDCTNAGFLDWAQNSNQTQVFNAYSLECSYPIHLKGMKLLDLDIWSCSLDLGFLLFISNTCVVFLVLLGSFTYHFLRWQLVYAYHLLLAFLWEKRQKHRESNGQFDAFVSYCSHDEPWVVQDLLPKLEGEQGWRLCLHHRDFEPGKSIVENIADAIFGSRKTICVVSRRYLRSQWCSREIQLASWRLFQEQKDVLILVLLEDIPPSELSPHYRTRKLLKKTTYLSWPEAAHTPQLFWDRLGRALGNHPGPQLPGALK